MHCHTPVHRDIHIIAVLQSARRIHQTVHLEQLTMQATMCVLHLIQKRAARGSLSMELTMYATKPLNVRAVRFTLRGISAGMCQVLPVHLATHIMHQRQGARQHPYALTVPHTMQVIIVATKQHMLVAPLAIHGTGHTVCAIRTVLLAEAIQ